MKKNGGSVACKDDLDGSEHCAEGAFALETGEGSAIKAEDSSMKADSGMTKNGSTNGRMASLRPPPPPSPPPAFAKPSSTLESLQAWFSRHKFITAVVVLATGTVVYRSYRSSVLRRKTRRARRSRDGGRVEVVLVAGSPALPLTRSLSWDLERKDFIVFVVSNGPEDNVLIQGLARQDIKSLSMDITDPPSAGGTIERFASYLQSHHAAIPQGKRHHLSLKGVILIPSLNYQTSPIATIPPSSFADLFNTHLLQPILTIQAFLPLLTARLGPSHSEKLSPKVLVLTPSIISSINPPFHAPEATICSALSAFTEVLAAELRPLAIPTTIWPDTVRHTYGRNFVNQSGSAISTGRIGGLRGSSLRDLHNAVFDVLEGSDTSATMRVGLGSSVYGFVGRFVPRGLVAWMMAIRKADELAAWQSSGPSSLHNSPRSPRSIMGSSGESETGGDENQESFVAVPEHHVGESHVCKEG
ncbi:hypothetical protein B0T26DRAFT_795320 [Lasiosphaeria miniovina]|uniref:DUF1776-domain-containing protein n=1 Tax=Lasiosphaeria miniovina TaxID=1954250 RepID=A0AA40DJ22_9PEZI|nr:uncharacterized protein B0T26DRAFT_795320 [Lasiosphaeria miniovina]KAK0701748.1 hypothetical protein B0T26DRAFT_795320 [Lasiosphaeria miniovina]